MSCNYHVIKLSGKVNRCSRSCKIFLDLLLVSRSRPSLSKVKLEAALLVFVCIYGYKGAFTQNSIRLFACKVT